MTCNISTKGRKLANRKPIHLSLFLQSPDPATGSELKLLQNPTQSQGQATVSQLKLDMLLEPCYTMPNTEERKLIHSQSALNFWKSLVDEPAAQPLTVAETRLRSLGRQHASTHGSAFRKELVSEEKVIRKSAEHWERSIEKVLTGELHLVRGKDFFTEYDLKLRNKKSGVQGAPTPDILFADHMRATYFGRRVIYIDAKSGYLAYYGVCSTKTRRQADKYWQKLLRDCPGGIGLWISVLGANEKLVQKFAAKATHVVSFTKEAAHKVPCV